jgi:hypothetical protein
MSDDNDEELMTDQAKKLCQYTVDEAVKAAGRHIAASAVNSASLVLVGNPAKLSGCYLPGKDPKFDDYWFFSAQTQDLRVGSTRIICLRKSDLEVVFDEYCDE